MQFLPLSRNPVLQTQEAQPVKEFLSHIALALHSFVNVQEFTESHKAIVVLEI